VKSDLMEKTVPAEKCLVDATWTSHLRVTDQGSLLKEVGEYLLLRALRIEPSFARNFRGFLDPSENLTC
jgi:hypothetical protein